MTFGLTLVLPSARKLSAPGSDIYRGAGQPFYQCFQNHYYGQRFVHANPQYIANVRLSINHWQIRDLVQIDKVTGAVFHTVDENVRVLTQQKRNFQNQFRSQNHVTLPYRPRCFHHAEGGVIVTGGVLTTLLRVYHMDVPDLTHDFYDHAPKRPAKGLFSVYSPEMGGEMSFQLGEMINNAVAVYPQKNSHASYTAYACNNDLGLYAVDISNRGIHGTRRIVCEASTSLNNVQESADGRTVTVTGDSGTVFIVDPALPQPVVQRICTGHDAGFGLAYHTNGAVLAAAFQDGACMMYDVRHAKAPLHEVTSTRPAQLLGAFRTCRFLLLSAQDVLAVLEHLGRVHLVDLRDLSQENHQVVVFPYALDQYARYKVPVDEDVLYEDDVLETDTHRKVGVYTDNAPFTAPLMYDYEYLAGVNPKPFKGFTYEPPQQDLVQDGTISKLDVLTTSQQCESTALEFGQSISQMSPRIREGAYLDAEAYHMYMRQSQQLYQQAVNHVNGEMEISGIDCHNNQLFVGCEDGGLLVWDVNVRGRRSFGSCSYM